LGSPELLKEFPLVLTTGTRIQSAFRSQHLNIPGLLKLQDKPNILIHPEDAQRRGIQDGDTVQIGEYELEWKDCSDFGLRK
jgi:anaerobic selenocysteine-containing dehydrogenase